MLICLLFLILKRRKLEKGSNYFIFGLGILTFIEIYCTLQKFINITYNSSILYVIGINLIVFLLFFLYFQSILISEKLKRVNLLLIVLFLLNYIGSAIFVENFFTRFPFFSYFVEVVLLTGSIFLVMSQTFNSDKILGLGHYFPFWVCISLLVTYLGVLPLLVISYTATNLMNLNIFFVLLFLVNVAGYTILFFGILKAKKEI
ncbi:hypothetical protein OA86_00250 [Kaistella jeonii]|uniref:Uncharacterized protein n=1 Tax=Kaistella jeonii TaxID=266749 RepID=A0A0C1D921_9FLAO|nr:hypothetical protein OA86_00250 [Kaistella jeonii]